MTWADNQHLADVIRDLQRKRTPDEITRVVVTLTYPLNVGDGASSLPCCQGQNFHGHRGCVWPNGTHPSPTCAWPRCKTCSPGG